MSKKQARIEATQILEDIIGPAWTKHMDDRKKSRAEFDAIRIPAQAAHMARLKKIEAGE